jgi:glycerate 2-kinase
MSAPRDLLRELFDAAIAAADPARAIAAALPPAPRGRTLVVGAGKAAAVMAAAVEEAWSGPLEGVVVTRYGHAAPTRRIVVREAAHPVPDLAGFAAAKEIAALAEGLTTDDLVLALWSGGGSALLPAPPEGLTLADLQEVGRALLASGADIHEMNCVRRHLSQLQGGRLGARCAPARVAALLVSDVPGDDPVDIASGPCSSDPTTCTDALRMIERYALNVPPRVREFLAAGHDETIKPGDPALARCSHAIVASPLQALEAAARRAGELGVATVMLGDRIQGEAHEAGRAQAALARAIAANPGSPRPCVLLSGGECTVTVRHRGRGGRNAEFLLGLMLALEGCPGVYALAADTDGIDGTEDNAGARLAPDSLARAAALGLDARGFLERNDSYGLFAALGDLVVTGPTRTNVNDFRAVLVT